MKICHFPDDHRPQNHCNWITLHGELFLIQSSDLLASGIGTSISTASLAPKIVFSECLSHVRGRRMAPSGRQFIWLARTFDDYPIRKFNSGSYFVALLTGYLKCSSRSFKSSGRVFSTVLTQLLNSLDLSLILKTFCTPGVHLKATGFY